MVKWLFTSFIPFTELLNCSETTKPPDLRLKISHTETKLQLPFFTSIFFIFSDSYLNDLNIILSTLFQLMKLSKVSIDSYCTLRTIVKNNHDMKKECESCVAIIHVEPVLYQKVMNYFYFNIIRVIERYSYHMISKEGIHYYSDKADRNKQAVLYCYYVQHKTNSPVKLNRGYSDFNFRGIVLQWVKTVVFYVEISPSMADKQEMYPLQFRKFFNTNFDLKWVKSNRNSLRKNPSVADESKQLVNVKVVWITLLCFRYDLQLIFSR
ncbi:hypothetical protein T06_888 [Trichinella sp. T6]|nr:hypothetical protein T06_888 [Trichinella sp. T6]